MGDIAHRIFILFKEGLEMKQERCSKFTCLVACLIMAIGILLGVPCAQAVDLLGG
jgi:hypothetical protein